MSYGWRISVTLAALCVGGCGSSGSGSVGSAEDTPVNVGGWIDSPHISPDGNELYFMYAPADIHHFNTTGEITRGGPDRPGHTTSGDQPEALMNSDLYVARRRAAGGWTVEALTSINRADTQECCPFLSWDGGSLYFMRSSFAPGAVPEYWVSKREGDGWGAPALAELPVVNGNVAFDSTGTKLYFDANQDPNAGAGQDIWVATGATGSGWSKPEKLPPAVNEPDQYSQTPWISPDEKRLYFHRFSKSGAGSALLVATRDASGEFTLVEPLDVSGPPVALGIGDRLFGEPSLPADEKRIYAQVWNTSGGPELWSGPLMGSACTLASVDDE